MGAHGEFQSPTIEDSHANQKAIQEEARTVLTWIKQIIVQNQTITITTKIQALKSLGEEGQRVWRASKIPYQEALDNFEIFANCINFHTRRQIAHLQKYLTAPDDVIDATSPPTTPRTSPPTSPLEGRLKRSESAPPTALKRWMESEDVANQEKQEGGNTNLRRSGGGGGGEEKTKAEEKRMEESRREEAAKGEKERPLQRPVSLNLDKLDLFILEDIYKHYVNHCKIGKGGFGDVFTAKSKKTGKTVALKSMRRSFEDHFKQIRREIKLMKESVHPNMVNYIESFNCDDHVWIVMEYCDGGSLRFLSKNSVLTEPIISYFAKQILQGLSYLHSQRRIHRDIKADNVLLNLDGSVKLADLGIAADLDDPDTPTELMNLCGSKFWMAPEMIKFKPYNYKVDIWGLGCLLIELAEARHPYEGQHSMAAMFHTATKGADPLIQQDKWSDAFKHFLAQCFQVNPLHRPSADEMLLHPFIKEHDSAEPEIKNDIIDRLQSVFVGLQLESMIF